VRSGALSVLLGAEWIMGGFYDVVLVVGAEQQKTMSSLDGSDVLGAAADYHNEKPEYGDFMFLNCSGGSRRFTSRNMARPRQT
jgi:acetyl-CoA acetyltransferase